MAETKTSAIQDIFEDAHAGRLDFYYARTVAYSVPGEMKRLKEVVEKARVELEGGAGGEAGARAALSAGVGLWIMRRFSEAAETLGKLEDHGIGRFFLGLSLTELGEYERAISSLEEAARWGEDEFACAMAIAEARRRAGNIEGAMAVIEEQAESFGDEAELHYQRGRCLEDGGAHEAAMEAYERAVELNPQHAGALFRLGYWYDLRGNDEQAIDCYEKAADIRPARSGVLLNLGMLYEEHGEYERAAALYERVLEYDRGNERARMYLKDARASMNMCYDEAMERHQSRTEQLLRTPLSDFELSARSRSCLEKMNVRTLGDLARLTEDEVGQSKNFGETSLSELRALLQSKGLHFGMGREMTLSDEETLSPENRSGVLARPIGELDLSIRSQKCMQTLGIETVGDLAERTERELLECQNFGQTSLEEVREKLAELGVSLKSS